MTADARRTLCMRVVCALLVALACAVGGQGVVANPPLIVRYESEASIRTPGGHRIVQPAGAEVDACAQGNIVARLDLATRTLHVLKPCINVFQNGFE